MACGCRRRKKAWLAKLEAKKAKGQNVQASAIGAALAVTASVGALIGMRADEQDPTDQPQALGGDSQPERAEPTRSADP